MERKKMKRTMKMKKKREQAVGPRGRGARV